VLLIVGSLLLVVGSVLNLAVIGRSTDSDLTLPPRARWVAQTRRHPLVRGVAVACIVAGVVLDLASL
jgi:hypothetical protein